MDRIRSESVVLVRLPLSLLISGALTGSITWSLQELGYWRRTAQKEDQRPSPLDCRLRKTGKEKRSRREGLVGRVETCT
ncbi:hypothetical protein ASPSYDRAFT_39630 [Aspergillus sydowii CBS 593.65]|uniref:Uncharacterized protein n=1 Tax=Aspergillus sydowii CBS 593.65 TaxID=1036612 RepID=A0A1L9TZM1_9EURO|nr:uncharacterized protein ASPSYDRAFT_39630 [Aspergillus sydowii CBS 593.65]OJJ64861.1 hypothetical protein ASPSYDRAFT_39630 [Aspergillus sydowii CBS 593.65]